MNRNFSNNFKTMRKQRGLTQEQIAETLGVSCQAVSKWETNTSYPDISLLPIIADFFGVSVDFLIGHDTSKQFEEIDNASKLADNMFTENRYIEAVTVLREMLIKHPGNEKLCINSLGLYLEPSKNRKRITKKRFFYIKRFLKSAPTLK